MSQLRILFMAVLCVVCTTGVSFASSAILCSQCSCADDCQRLCYDVENYPEQYLYRDCGSSGNLCRQSPSCSSSAPSVTAADGLLGEIFSQEPADQQISRGIPRPRGASSSSPEGV